MTSSTCNIDVFGPDEEESKYTTYPNTLDLQLDPYDNHHPSLPSLGQNYPPQARSDSSLSNNSTIHDNTYGPASVVQNHNSARPQLTNIDTSFGYPQFSNPLNIGLQSTNSITPGPNNLPASRYTFANTMQPTYPPSAHSWNSGCPSPNNDWSLLSAAPSPAMTSRSSSGTLYNSPMSAYVNMDGNSSPSNHSSPGLQGSSPVSGGGHHYITPSPQQVAHPLTPDSATYRMGSPYFKPSPVSANHMGLQDMSPMRLSLSIDTVQPTSYSPNVFHGNAQHAGMPGAMIHGANNMRPNGSANGMLSASSSACNSTSYGHGMMTNGRGHNQLPALPPLPNPATLRMGSAVSPTELQFASAETVVAHARKLFEFIPQLKYKPHTNSDQRRYVDDVALEAPIYFITSRPGGGRVAGISLSDAMTSRFMALEDRDELMFKDRGPSISVRLHWRGYQSWSRQIPTRDFKSPPGPITKAKLAKNVAKSIQRFIDENKDRVLESDEYMRWAVGDNKITIDDLWLVGMHHVSMGSWQADLRLNSRLPHVGS